MDSRERLKISLAHQEPDRPPLDLGSTTSSGISAVAYHHLMNSIDIPSRSIRVFDVVQQLAIPDDSVVDGFEIDIIDIGRAFNTLDADWYDFTLPGGIVVQYPYWFRPVLQPDGSVDIHSRDGEHIGVMPTGSTFFDQTHFPYLDGYPSDFSKLSQALQKVTWTAWPVSPFDRSNETNFWEMLRQKTIDIRKSTERALVIAGGCKLFEVCTFLRRMDNFLMDLALDPLNVERLLDALMEQYLVFLEKLCDAVGDLVDVIRFGDDFGMDHGLLISPATYRKFFMPRQKVLCDYVKTHSQMRIFLHSCGSIYDIIPDLIEVGYEILNPVQFSARKMELERLKRDFGESVTFWGGGCDTRSILNRATPQEVKEHVYRNLEILSPGGGFVFCAVHNILPDVPPENIVAMYTAARDFYC